MKSIDTCILFSTADWDAPYWTNKQHTAKNLASKGIEVLYIESIGLRTPNLTSGLDVLRLLRRLIKGLRGVNKVEDNIYVLSPMVLPFLHNQKFIKKINNFFLGNAIKKYKATRKIFNGEKNTILWSYHPYILEYITSLSERFIVYHCVDDLSSIPGIDSKKFARQEDLFLTEADIIFTTTPSLYEKCKAKNRNTHYFPNVVDWEHFSAISGTSDGLRGGIEKIRQPRIVYSGVLSDFKVDFNLLKNVFERQVNWNLILIGEEREGQNSKIFNQLIGMNNVHYVGYRNYQDLPEYLQSMDVALLPTLKNQYTKHMFPMKYFEYIASGLRIASTSLEFIDSNHGDEIEVGDTVDDYIKAIALQLERGKIDSSVARQIVADNTWEDRLNSMLEMIKNA